MPSTNCKINFDLNWSKTGIIVVTAVANQSAAFSITDKKLYVRVVTLSTQDNSKLLEQLKPGFKRTINWNNYQSKISTVRPDQYLDYLSDATFQGVNRLFVFSCEDKSYKQHFFTTVEIKNHNVMINGQNFLITQ